MRALIAALLFATIALTGCFGGDGEDDDDHMDGMDDGMNQTSTQTATGQPRDPVTWDLDVADNSFPDGSITIQVGDTVRWTQSGSNPHTVTADDDSFDSHPDCNSFQDSLVPGTCMGQDDTFEHTFDTVGEVGYHCKVHGSPGSGMSATITVAERHDATPSG